MNRALKIHGASDGVSQKQMKLKVAPAIQMTHVRIVLFFMNLSVNHPATSVPRTPPISSDAATMLADSEMSNPLYWVRKEVPHSRIVNRITYTQKSATATIHM